MLIKSNNPIPLELTITDPFSQKREDIDTVTFRIYHRDGGSIVEDITTTTMLGSGSLWYFEVSSGLNKEGLYTIEYTITDNLGDIYTQSESLIVGYMQEEIELIKDIESGKWEIKDNMMIFYKEDGTTEIIKFNLYDSKGKPSMGEVFKRVRV